MKKNKSNINSNSGTYQINILQGISTCREETPRNLKGRICQNKIYLSLDNLIKTLRIHKNKTERNFDFTNAALIKELT